MKRQSPLDHAQLVAEMNEAILIGMELAQPGLWYRNLPSEECSPALIPRVYGSVSTMTFFLSTLGEKIDQGIQHLSEQGDILRAVFLDSWASECLERMNDRFDHRLTTHLCRTRRFSPGYGDIHLNCNAQILELIAVDKVRAHPRSGALIPRKSTVCMIGWKTVHYNDLERYL